MATRADFIDYACEQLKECGRVYAKKMFGEYMIYVNDKPLITVCNNTAYVKKREEIKEMMQKEETGYPYKGAKGHYILPLEDIEFCTKVVKEIDVCTPLSKKKKNNKNN